MRRTKIGTLLAAGAVLGPVAFAWGGVSDVGIIEGQTTLTPACPGKPCLAVTRTTGFQVKVGTERAIQVAPRDGRIVAWKITLGRPGTKQAAFFDKNTGGEAAAQLTILRPGRRQYYRVVAQGEPRKLKRWFGKTVQFPLEKSIPVKKGQIIALTVPTWAPALALNQPGTSSWRASRIKGRCNDFDRQTAQTGTNNVARWFCLYRTAQLTYSATIVSTPTTKNPT